jgi:hypothetical protein
MWKKRSYLSLEWLRCVSGSCQKGLLKSRLKQGGCSTERARGQGPRTALTKHLVGFHLPDSRSRTSAVLSHLPRSAVVAVGAVGAVGAAVVAVFAVLRFSWVFVFGPGGGWGGGPHPGGRGGVGSSPLPPVGGRPFRTNRRLLAMSALMSASAYFRACCPRGLLLAAPSPLLPFCCAPP